MLAEAHLVEFMLAVVVIMLVRSREVSIWQVIMITVFGYYLWFTPASGLVLSIVQGVVAGFVH